MARKRSYHHGDLPAELLIHTALAIEEVGTQGLSLRDVARRAGVSHAAPAHHFGDKTGLLTALAAEGFDRLSLGVETIAQQDAAKTRADQRTRFLAVGMAYVRFARANPAHFRVMFSPRALQASDANYMRARTRALGLLMDTLGAAHPKRGHESMPDPELLLAAWSLVHGIASLALDGNLDDLVPETALDGVAESVLKLVNEAVARAR